MVRWLHILADSRPHNGLSFMQLDLTGGPQPTVMAGFPGWLIEAPETLIPEHSSGFIPFARVIHAKFLVVDDRISWLGTSNWSGDYFHRSRNVGVMVEGQRLAAQLETVFDGLWNGPYAIPVDPEASYPKPRIGP